jgi:hypothetical protein
MMTDVMADGASGEIDDPPYRYLRGLEMRLGPLPSYPCLRKEVAGSLHTNPWLVPLSVTRI